MVLTFNSFICDIFSIKNFCQYKSHQRYNRIEQCTNSSGNVNLDVRTIPSKNVVKDSPVSKLEWHPLKNERGVLSTLITKHHTSFFVVTKTKENSFNLTSKRLDVTYRNSMWEDLGETNPWDRRIRKSVWNHLSKSPIVRKYRFHLILPLTLSQIGSQTCKEGPILLFYLVSGTKIHVCTCT